MSEMRRKGVAIAFFAVACVTPDAMLLRWARTYGATAWQTAFFKNGLVGLLNLCSAVYLGGGPAALFESMRKDPLALAFASLLQIGDQLGFTFSFLTTETARAMLFISLNPVWAALLGCFVLGDRLPARTMALLGAGLFSALIVFLPSVLPASWTADMSAANDDAAAHKHATSGVGPATTDHQPATLHGDIIAMCTGLCLASYVTFIRYCAKFRPGAAVDAAPSFGNLMASALALVMTELTAVGPTGGALDFGVGFLAIIAVNSALVAAFYVGFTLAPRYITGAEVALILLMETVCGPLWVFLRFGDKPTVWTIAGGAVLIVSLAAHEIAGLTESSRQMAAVARLSGSPPPPGRDMIVPAKEGGGSDYQCFSDGAQSTASAKK